MGKITALRETKGRDRINLYLDGRFAFSLSADLVSSEGLTCDQVLTEDKIDSLAKSDRHQRCLMAGGGGLVPRRPAGFARQAEVHEQRRAGHVRAGSKVQLLIHVARPGAAPSLPRGANGVAQEVFSRRSLVFRNVALS